MDVASLIISLLSGVVGGNVAGKATPDNNLGALGNSISGLLGGAAGGYLLQALDLFNQAGAAGAANAVGGSGLDFPAILANIGTSGIGGAILAVVVNLIKNSMQKTS